MKRLLRATSIAFPLAGIIGGIGLNCSSPSGTFVSDGGGNSGSGSGSGGGSSSGDTSSSSSSSGAGGTSSGGSGAGSNSSSSGADSSSSSSSGATSSSSSSGATGSSSSSGAGSSGAASSGSSSGTGSSSGPVGDAGPATIDSLVGIPNMYGETLKSSYMLFGCYAQMAQDCFTTPGAQCVAPQCTPAVGTAAPLEQQGLVTHDYYQLGGTVGRTYTMTLQANGILEAKYYTGGVRFAGNADPPSISTPTGLDTFYTGGTPVNVENYNVYKIVVRNPPAAGAAIGTGTEVAHYYANSFPQTGTKYEDHMTFPIAWTHDIPVPGGGVIEYLTEDRNEHAVDNCGYGHPFNGTCIPNNVPNEPNFVVPAMYMGQSVTSMNTITHLNQPYHSQIVHYTVTAVR